MNWPSNHHQVTLIKQRSIDPLGVIAGLGRETCELDRVCWHFCRFGGWTDDDDELFSDGFYERAKQVCASRFPEMDFIRAAFGSFETWETAKPTRDWLYCRLDDIRDFANEAGAWLEGWSYEPKDRPFSSFPQAFAIDEDE